MQPKCMIRAVTRAVVMMGVLTVMAGSELAPLPLLVAQSMPPSIQKAFQRIYPGAVITSVREERDGNRPVYRVELVDKGRRKRVLFDQSAAVIEAGEQLEEKDLPQPVAAAMHEHRRAIFVTGMRVTRGSSVRYELALRGTRKTFMVVQSDGTVLSFK